MAVADPERATCASVTRAGHRCKAAPLAGRDVCLAHADAQTRQITKFGGRQAGAGRPRKPSAPDALRVLLEQHVEVILRPFYRALGYDVQFSDHGTLTLVPLDGGGAKLYGIASRDGNVNMSEHDDLRMQVQVAEKIFDRVYGKPRQMVELPAENTPRPDLGKGLNLRLLTNDEVEQLGELYQRVEARERSLSAQPEQPSQRSGNGRPALSVVQ